MPTTFSYTNTNVSRRGTFLSSQDQDIFDLASSHQKKNSITQLNANYRNILQTNEGDTTEIQTSNNYLRNIYYFKEDQSKRLMSDLIYSWTDSSNLDDSMLFTTTDLRWTEELHWTHGENLWTNYKLLNQKQKTDNSEIDTKSIGATLQHLLYENLTTNIDGEVSRYEYTGARDDEYNGKLNFDYSRKIPLGVINLTTGFDAVATNRDSEESWIWITNEPHTVTTGGVTFVSQENVDEDSIRVTDKSGTIVYVRDQDYTVEALDSLIRIRPTFIGNITSGQKLLISYRYTNANGYDDIVFSRWAGINVFLWSTLRLSYDYYRATQEILSGTEPDNPINDTIHKAQARVLWKWTDTTVLYEDYDTLLSSARTTWQLNEQLQFLPTRGLSIDFSGYLGNTSFKRSNEEEDFYRVATKIIWSPAYWNRTGFETYHYAISGKVQDASNSGILAFIDFFYGKWTCSLSYRYLDHVDEIRDFDRARQGFMFKLTRAIW